MADTPIYRSTSQRRTYRSCGYKHMLKYRLGWRKRRDHGSFQFGHVMQDVANGILMQELTTAEQAAAFFLTRWAPFETQPDLDWPKTKPWTLFRDRGVELAKHMVEVLPQRIRNPKIIEQEIRFEIAPGTHELAIPDLYAEVLGADGVWRWTILDFKTSDRDYHALAAENDEQLTDYELALRSQGEVVEQLGLCVLIYGAKPRIQWLLTPPRSQALLDRFVHTAVVIDQAIKAETYYTNDRACLEFGGCEYIPICFASQAGERDKTLKLSKPGAAFALTWEEDDT